MRGAILLLAACTAYGALVRPAIGMARCRTSDVLRLDAWRKLYAGRFGEPGLGGRDTPVLTGGRP